jgi:hypothetical protein
MDSKETFPFFPAFPTEIRLQIYSEALPCRILQMGYDFPFPFLPLPDTCPEITRWQTPIPVSYPALFFVCHESRQLCKSIYLPFAYSYAHPLKDTIYISSSAADLLHQNLNWYYMCARPPLYPLAEVARVAVEFDWLDLPSEARLRGGWIVVGDRRYLHSSLQLDSYLAAFGLFGLPKEVLIVGGTRSEAGNSDSLIQATAWKTITFGRDPNINEPRKSDVVLQFMHDSLYYRRGDFAWFGGELPNIKIVSAERTGEVSRDTQSSRESLNLAVELAEEWRSKEYNLHSRAWDSEHDGCPYDKENMVAALRRARAAI